MPNFFVPGTKPCLSGNFGLDLPLAMYPVYWWVGIRAGTVANVICLTSQVQ
jgi:hypothetical protein